MNFKNGGCVLVLVLTAFCQVFGRDTMMIDDGQYANDRAAATAWKPTEGGAAPAKAGTVDGRKVLQFPCSFAGSRVTRAAWDRKVDLDLSSARGVQFDFLCRKTLPASYFNIYFQSGQGWYSAIFFPDSSSDWNTIVIDKSQMKTEGKPAGWNHIKTVRIAAYRAGNQDTEFFVTDLHKTEPLPAAGTKDFAEKAIADCGTIASFKNFEAATNEIIRMAPGDERVTKTLSSATAQRDEAKKLVADGKFDGAVEHTGVARELLKNAFCQAQKPQSDEFRAFWCHSALGVPGVSWDEAIRRLAENGFTAIIPNMLSGGSAFYDSKVLPVVPQVARRGDQIRECLAACRKYGIKMHVWKLDWNLGGAAPKDFVEKLRQEHRLQESSNGKEELWLCPSNPDNRKLEADAMLEVVRNYDVDGIHFDYIRYPDIDHCFCDGCRQRFQQATGADLKQWPADVLEGGPLRQQWLDWRRANITSEVKMISEQARAIKPGIQISAAVFRYWTTDRDAVGQDWKLWCDKGYLDFVCPMDYTPSKARFADMVLQQVQWAGKVRCYPGLGVSSSSSRFGVDRAIEEINVTRSFDTHGFVIFNLGSNECRELLPALALGETRKQ
jgi:uncharacterized lipoprotein YddW (UPF0748 family)